jgi:hypothetical protein
MPRSGLMKRLAGFVFMVVVSAFALRGAYEQLRPVLPLLIVLVVLFGLWRVYTFFRSRW